ncbi:MAG: carboxypeptidase-like regulatory domain-containing protein [Bacteroidales bacterium]
MNFRIFLVLAGLIIVSGSGLFAQISGTVKDTRGLPVAGVEIFVEATGKGTVSDSNGVFVVQAIPGEILTFRHLNYQRYYLTLQKQTQDLNVILTGKIQNLPAARIRARNKSSHQRISEKKIKELPIFLGEHDVVKYLATLPGVLTKGLLHSGLHVRGGKSSQNGFFVHQIEVAHPRHLSGILTTYDPYVFGSAELYKGLFPARFNGYLSSYINMGMKNYDENGKFSGEVHAGIVSSSLKARFPLWPKTDAMAVVSVRKSYYDFWNRYREEVSDESSFPAYSFGDISLGSVIPLGNHWEVSFMGLATADELPIDMGDYIGYAMDWGTYNGVLTLKGSFADSSALQVSVGGTAYHAMVETEGRVSLKNKHQERTVQSKVLYKKRINNSLYLTTTGGVQKKFFIYDQWKEAKVGSFDSDFSLFQLSAEMKYYFNNRISLSGGLNGIVFQRETAQYALAPRMGLKKSFSRSAIWFNYSRTHQFHERIQVLTVESPVDYSIPIDGKDRPAISDQFSLGVSYSGIRKGFFSLEAYYRELSNCNEIAPHDRTTLKGLYSGMMDGDGYAFGVEVQGEFAYDDWLLRGNYTYSRTMLSFDKIAGDDFFYPGYDMPHRAMISFHYRLSRKFGIKAAWTYRSGAITTLPTGIAISQSVVSYGDIIDVVPLYNQKYNYRLPPSHHLDLNVDYYGNYSNNHLVVSVGVYNLYNRENADFIYLVPYQKSAYYTKFKITKRALLPLLPYAKVTLKF